jgi:hypothetical protein
MKDDQAAVYLGLRKLEWLFLTCHNSWVVFRLTKVGNERVLAYSPMIDISNSSLPFRTFLGATLSVIRNIPVRPTVLPVNAIMDMLPEDERNEERDAEPSDDDSDDESGSSYTPSTHGAGSQSVSSVDNVDTFMVCYVTSLVLDAEFKRSTAHRLSRVLILSLLGASAWPSYCTFLPTRVGSPLENLGTFGRRLNRRRLLCPCGGHIAGTEACRDFTPFRREETTASSFRVSYLSTLGASVQFDKIA